MCVVDSKLVLAFPGGLSDAAASQEHLPANEVLNIQTNTRLMLVGVQNSGEVAWSVAATVQERSLHRIFMYSCLGWRGPLARCPQL